MAASYDFSDNLGYLLNRCAARLASRFAEELAPHDISLAQWGALLAIFNKVEASPSDVADTVGIDRGAATRLIGRMEAKGQIVRRAHAVDGRSVILSLTPSMREKMPALIRLSQRVNRDALADLSEAEATVLLRSLAKLLNGPNT